MRWGTVLLVAVLGWGGCEEGGSSGAGEAVVEEVVAEEAPVVPRKERTAYRAPTCSALPAAELKTLLELEATPTMRQGGSSCDYLWGAVEADPDAGVEGEPGQRVTLGYRADLEGDAEAASAARDRMASGEGFEAEQVPPLEAAFWREDAQRLFGYGEGGRTWFVDVSKAGLGDGARATAKAILAAAAD